MMKKLATVKPQHTINVLHFADLNVDSFVVHSNTHASFTKYMAVNISLYVKRNVSYLKVW